MEEIKLVLYFVLLNTDSGPRLNILEVGVAKDRVPAGFKKQANLKLQANDFPVSLLPDSSYGVLWLITKMGFLYLYEIQSGKGIFAQKASQQTMFCSIEVSGDGGGIMAVDQSGLVSKFEVNRDTIVQHICNKLKDYDLGVNMARRFNLPGADNIFKQQFTNLMQQQQYEAAMKLAATSPQGILRTIDTISALKKVQGSSYLGKYFQMLLKLGSLNTIESVELCSPIIARNQGLDLIKGWLKDKKLEPSEDLGDLLNNHNVSLALSVYVRANIPHKVISCFLSLAAQEQNEQQVHNHFNQILEYSNLKNYKPDYLMLLQQIASIQPDRAKDFALIMINHKDGPKVDITRTIDIFMSLPPMGDVKNTTNILLEYLKPRGDLEEDGLLQTKLLEINLLQVPKVANAIFASEEYNFTHYDKEKIGKLCEQARLYQRALEHYSDLNQIKRVLQNTHLISAEFLLEYFGKMTPENCLECLRDLLKNNLAGNIRLVVEIAKKWSDLLTPSALIELFEEFNSHNGLYFYLGHFVNNTENPDIIFKYLQAATKLGQIKEVERLCRENEHFEPVEVKEFLLAETQIQKDPRPLIHVCDRFGYVDELIQYLYSMNMYMFISAYVTRMNPKACPEVIGNLLELNANEEKIRELLESVHPPAGDTEFVEKLINSVERAGRLKLIRPFLEARNQEGSEDPHVHNGLAKIYVEVNNQPTHFLTSNKYYQSEVVGKFCESRDPHLAFVAYKRGSCDDQLIEVTNRNGFFRDQARYLVERQDPELWSKVLVEENEYRRQLIDQVVATALPESRTPEEVSNTVKAFMAAELPNELIELLEKIILFGSTSGEFHNNRNLQNLLILTAIKADKKRVMNYVERLDNYDGPDIAKIAVSDQHKLYEEAFYIYKKCKKGPEAIEVLLDNMENIDRATEFAEYQDDAEVWSLLAKAQLDQNLVKEAIVSYLKADDASNFQDVLTAAKSAQFFSELIAYIKMARSKVKDPLIDNELIYCFAKTEKLAQLEEFITGSSHVAKISDAGDRCFDDDLYHAARILYNHVNNNAKLALCLVKLEFYQDAVNAAQKANAIPTWKAVCFACIDAKEFRLAQMCGLNIVVYMDHLPELVRHYEKRMYFEEAIQLLEQGINLNRAHQGIFTTLGILYCKYKEDKIMEHIKMFWSRVNITVLLGACQEFEHWPEAVFLYRHYDQFDQAVQALMEHSPQCWSHELFKECIKKVANTEIYYQAIEFYLSEQPMLLNDLLMDLTPQLDAARVVNKIKKAGYLPLIEKYMIQVQGGDIVDVNEKINQLYIEMEDYDALRKSIETYTAFDQLQLAQQLEKHALVQFRRISAYLYKINKRWDKSTELSKGDQIWQDAMETTAASGHSKQAENLLRYFVEKEEQECFAACLFTCYDLITPDVVLELAWRYDLQKWAMPYMVQVFKEVTTTLEEIQEKYANAADVERAIEEERKKQEEDLHNKEAAFVGTGQSYIAEMQPLGLPAPGMVLATPQMVYGNQMQPHMAVMGVQPQGNAMQQGFYH